YGYRRVHALIRRHRRERGEATVNVKRVYRVMKAHGLLLERHTGSHVERRTMAASPSIGPTRAGARTGSRSAATTASGCASPSLSTAATARQSPGWRRPAASTAATFAT